MKYLFTTIFIIVGSFTFGQLIVDTDATNNDMLNSLSGPGVTTTNVTINCAKGAYGTFDGTNANVGVNGGILLTTGLADEVDDCVYTLNLGDDNGDQWDCGEVLVYVDGVLQATLAPTAAGFGWLNYNIFVPVGSTVTVEYQTTGGAGCDELEHTLTLNDPDGNTLAQYDNWGGTAPPIPPGVIYTGVANCNPAAVAFPIGFPAVGPNDSDLASYDQGVVNQDPDLMMIDPNAGNDVCIMEFDIIPTCDTLQINYVFASEEYPDYVCAQVNDVFAFFISGPGIAGPFSGGAENIALIPGTNTPVSINTVNGGVDAGGGNCPPGGLNNTAYFVDNGNGNNCPGQPHCTDPTTIRYNGMTVPLTAKSPVTPCETYHMKLIISDVLDHAFDSGVFLNYQGLACPNGNDITPSVINDPAIEGCVDGVFQVARDGDLTNTTTVNITTGGTATNGVDYTGVPNSITFNPGDTLITLPFTAVADGIGEGAETVVLVFEYTQCNNPVFDTLTMNIIESPTLSFTTNPATCGQADGDATVTMDAPGVGPFTYQWDAAAGNQTVNPALGLALGSYAVTVTDANGCVGTDTVSGANIGGPTMNMVITDQTCLGTDDGTIAATAATGNPVFQYQIDGGALQATGNFTNLAPGNYTISVIDGTGCQADSIVTVGAGICCITTTSNMTPASCFGQCDGTATTTPLNTTGTINYDWLNNVGVSLGQNTATANTLCAGSYSVTITDDVCSITDTITVLEPLEVTVTNSGDTTICIGGTATATAIAQNGVPPITYNWTGAIGSPIMVTPSQDTTLSVFAVDGNGCSSVTTTLTVSLNPVLTAQTSTDETICLGETANISASANGGDGNYTYTWDNGLPSISNHTVSPTVTTTYNVTVSDGCETPDVTGQVTVTVEQTPYSGFTGAPLVGCTPVNAVFASDSTAPAGATCVWDFGNGITANTCGNASHNYVTPGLYTVSYTVTSANGCTSASSQTDYVEVYPIPTADFYFSPTNPTLISTQVNFTNTSLDETTYSWLVDGVEVSTQENPGYTFPLNVVDNYNVCLAVANDAGCADTTCKVVEVTDIFMLYAPNAITADADGQNDEFKISVVGYDETDFVLYIFDRWGHKVFETSDPNVGWDGSYQGVKKEDVYVWKVETKDKITGEEKVFYGHIMVVR